MQIRASSVSPPSNRPRTIWVGPAKTVRAYVCPVAHFQMNTGWIAPYEAQPNLFEPKSQHGPPRSRGRIGLFYPSHLDHIEPACRVRSEK